MGAGASLRYLYYNVKLILNLNVAAAIALVLMTPVIFSFALIGEREVARVMELYVSIIGIILFAYVSSIEWSENIKEVIYIRKTPYVFTLIIRIALVSLLSAALITGVLTYARLQDAVFPMFIFTMGTLISAMYLGMIAFTVTNFTGQLSAGYLASFGYYIFEYMTKGKYTGDFYMFSLMKHEFYCKYNILIVVLVLLLINIVFMYRRS